MADVADDILRSGYDRWTRLEEAKAVVAEDLKELFAELKANGFDTKALRAAFRHVAKLDDLASQEHEAVVDLYVASLTGARPADAHVENTREFRTQVAPVGQLSHIETAEVRSLPTAPEPAATSSSRVMATEAGEGAIQSSPAPQSGVAQIHRNSGAFRSIDSSSGAAADPATHSPPVTERPLPPGRIRLDTGEVRMEGCQGGIMCGSASATKERCSRCETAWKARHQEVTA